MSPMLLITTLLIGFVLAACAEDAIVSTNNGLVRGTADDAQGIITFLGIPYGKAPVGNLRFQKPEKVESWGEEIYDATRFGFMCLGNGFYLSLLQNLEENPDFVHPVNEDCLNLNIFYPGTMDDIGESQKPVMIWIHGGGYMFGTSSVYDGSKFAVAEDVVYVTFNYRLGLLGFASTPDGLIPGNMGLYDQRLAMQWVQENIVFFGGDPTRVTIQGQSAAGDGVLNHIASPLTNGLFRRAIIQSTYEIIPQTSAEKYPVLQSIVQTNYNCDVSSTATLLACLQSLTLEEIDTVDYNSLVYLNYMLNPIIIENEFLPESTFRMLRKGLFDKSLDVIIGFNGNDGDVAVDFFLNSYPSFVTEGIPNVDTALQLMPFIWSSFFTRLFANTQCDLQALQAIAGQYFATATDPLDIAKIFFQMVTDGTAINTGLKFARALAKNSHIHLYMYYFDFRSDTLNDFPDVTPAFELSAGHAEEDFYVFGKGTSASGSQEDIMMQSFMRAWGEFARSGKPVYLTNDLEEANWKQFKLGERKKYFHIAAPLTSKSGSQKLLKAWRQNRKFWRGLQKLVKQC